MASSPLVRVDVKYIIQGIDDRTESTSYGVGVENQEVKFLTSKWWENDNETLMKVYSVYGDPRFVKVVEGHRNLEITDLRTDTVVTCISVGR
jgi:hypothetical protein